MFRIRKITINNSLLISIILFMIISFITIYSSMLYLSSSLGNLALKQLTWYGIGFLFIIFIIDSKIDIKKYSLYFYLFNVFLLGLLLIIGQPINGSKCWFIVPGIGSFQPSEFMKIAIILLVSKIISNWTSNITSVSFKSELCLFIKIIFIMIPPILLTFLEPDTGAVIIYMVIIISMLWTSPVRKRWFFIIFLISLTILSVFLYIYFFKQDLFFSIFGEDLYYRIDRVLDWKNGTGMQLENSLTAIGSSGFTGHGYRSTPIYFPESGTDFIFAVFSSNFGLIGSFLLVFLLVFFDRSLISIGKIANNTYDKYIISGTIGMLLYQQIQNIGMTLGMLPITGITLPFISYGGSSLLSYLLIIGIIFKIYNNRFKTIN